VKELLAGFPILPVIGLHSETGAAPADERAAKKYGAEHGGDHPMDQQARHGDNRDGD
jgi:hypothetical protein